MKKYKILIFIASIVLLSSLAFSVFAYYSVFSSKEVTANTSISDDQTIEIASFDDLFRYTKRETYNDNNNVSDVSNRKILKLTNSIRLMDDLLVSADIHLDLNNNTLDLNNKDLLFRNGYDGCFSIYGGTIITGGTGTITIDLVKGGFVTDSLVFKETSTGEAISSTSVINILNLDAKYTAYTALYYAANAFVSDLNSRPKFEDYNTVSNNSFILSSDKFISSKKCSYNSNNTEACSFVYKDLDLLTYYLSSDISISYESSNTTYLTNEGDVTIPSTEEDVTLTISISSSLWSDDIECDFDLHIVNLSNSTVKNAVGNILINSFLSDYYVPNSLIIKEEVILPDYYYEFNHSTELPLTALDGSIGFRYSTTDLLGNAAVTTSHTENGVYVFEPNDNCYHLIVTVNGVSNSPLNMYSTYVGDYETIARLIINDLYGGSIVYDSSNSQTELVSYANLGTSLSSADLYAFISEYNVSNMTYAIKSGSTVADAYNLSGNILTVKDGVVPEAKLQYITVTFTFGLGATAQTIDIDLYVDYLAQSGDTLAGFLPYYNIFETMVENELITEFRMPFSYNGGYPYVCYDFATTFTEVETSSTDYDPTFEYYNYTLGAPSSLQVILYYNGTEHALDLSSYTTSLTNQLNRNQLATIAAYGDAEYIFRLNPQSATTENVKVLLIYNYLFNTGNEWSRYEYSVKDSHDVENKFVTDLTSSQFEVKGGLFYNASSSATNAVKDKYFFAWIYNNFNPSKNDTGFTPISDSSVNSTLFIPLDWLGLDVALDNVADSTLSSVSDYSGIGYLTKISTVNLRNKNLSSTVLTSISSMNSVTTLNLVNCGITDITAISSMDSVKSLNISNNSIKDFSNLINMESLEEVILHSNEASSEIYGSLGVINYQTYEDLMRNGISVYNLVSNNIPVLYADSDQQTDYSKLKAIAYQKRLSKSKSIEDLYQYFSTTYSSYNLTSFKASITWSAETGVTVYNATYFQASVTYGGYTLVVKFYVDRY